MNKLKYDITDIAENSLRGGGNCGRNNFPLELDNHGQTSQRMGGGGDCIPASGG